MSNFLLDDEMNENTNLTSGTQSPNDVVSDARDVATTARKEAVDTNGEATQLSDMDNPNVDFFAALGGTVADSAFSVDEGAGGAVPETREIGFGEKIRKGVEADIGREVSTLSAVANRMIPFLGKYAKMEANERIRLLEDIITGEEFDDINSVSYETFRKYGWTDGSRTPGEAKERRLQAYYEVLGDEANSIVNSEEYKQLSPEDKAKALRPLAEKQLREIAQIKQSAQQTLANTTQGTWSKIGTGIVENTGYTLEFVVGTVLAGGHPAGGFAVAGTASALERGSTLATNDYEIDERGELVNLNNALGEVEAARQGTVGGFTEAGVETALGWGVGKLGGVVVKGIAKVPGAKYIGNNVSKLAQATKGKLSHVPGAQMLAKLGRGYSSLSHITGQHEIPMELLEENVQSFFDDVVGLAAKKGEYEGFGKEWENYKRDTLNWDTQRDILLGMVGTMVLQGAGGAYLDKRRRAPGEKKVADAAKEKAVHYSPKEARGRLELLGFGDKLNSLSDSQAVFLANLSHTMEKFTPEELLGILSRQDARVQNLAMEISKKRSWEYDQKLAEIGESAEFTPDNNSNGLVNTLPGEYTDDNGNKHEAKIVLDTAHGVGIRNNMTDEGDAFTVVDNRGNKIGVSSMESALIAANMLVKQNAVKNAENKQKAEYISQIIAQNYGTDAQNKFQLRNTMTEFIDEMRANGASEDTIQRFRQEQKKGTPGVRLDDGRVFLFLDNITSPIEAAEVLQHEVIGHDSVINKFGGKEGVVKFLRSLDSKTMRDYTAAAVNEKKTKLLAIRKYIGEEITPELEAQVEQEAMEWATTDEGIQELFARLVERRRHNPAIWQKLAHRMRQRARDKGVNKPINDNDLEVILSQMEKESGKVSFTGQISVVPSMSVGGMTFLRFEDNIASETDADVGGVEGGDNAITDDDYNSMVSAVSNLMTARDGATPSQSKVSEAVGQILGAESWDEAAQILTSLGNVDEATYNLFKRAFGAEGGASETGDGAAKTPAQSEQAQGVPPPAGEKAGSVEAGKAPTEVGGKVNTKGEIEKLYKKDSSRSVRGDRISDVAARNWSDLDAMGVGESITTADGRKFTKTAAKGETDAVWKGEDGKSIKQLALAETAGDLAEVRAKEETARREKEERAQQRAKALKEANKLRAGLYQRFIDEWQLNPNSIFAYWHSMGGKIFEMPKTDKKGRFINDPAADTLNNFFDGLKGAQREMWKNRIFGYERNGSSSRGNDVVSEEVARHTNNEELVNNYDEILDTFLNEYEEFLKWKQSGAVSREEREAADRAEAEEAAEREFYLGELADKEVADKEYNNAFVEVEKYDNGHPFIKMFSASELSKLQEGDTIRFDHADIEWVVVSYDKKRGILTVKEPNWVAEERAFSEGMDLMPPKEMRYVITKNGISEYKEEEKPNEPEDKRRTSKDVNGDEQGKRGESTPAKDKADNGNEVVFETKDGKKERVEGYVKPTDDIKVGDEVVLQHDTGGSINARQKIFGTVTDINAEGGRIKVDYQDPWGYDQDVRVKPNEIIGIKQTKADADKKTTIKTSKTEQKVPKTGIADKKTAREAEKAPTAAKEPSVKMKDEAAEKRAKEAESALAALFSDPDYAIMGANEEEYTSYNGPQRVVEESDLPFTSFLASHNIVGLDRENGTLIESGVLRDAFEAFETRETQRKLFRKVFDVAEKLGCTYKVDYSNRSDTKDKLDKEELAYELGGRIVFHIDRLDRENNETIANTILHELIHGVTSYAIDISENQAGVEGVTLPTSLHNAVRKLRVAYKLSKPFVKGTYEASNIHEFVAGLADPAFRRKLDQKNLLRRALDAIVDIFRALFGHPTTTKEAVNSNRALKALHEFLENFDRTAFETHKNAADEDASRANYAIDQDKRELFQKRAGAVMEIIEVYRDSGVAEFKTLATRMFEGYPDKFENMKSHLRGIWNYIAEQEGLEEVSKDEANRIYDSLSVKPEVEEIVPTEPKAPPSNKLQSTRISDAADEIVELLEKGKPFTRKQITDIVERQLDGKVSKGDFDAKQVTDILELAINRYIKSKDSIFSPSVNVGSANAVAVVNRIRNILDIIPTQTTRSVEQDRLQQFSTPPHEGFVAAWVANINNEDVMLEPSAGIGGLAVFADVAGAKVILNEYSPRRGEILEELGLGKPYSHDAQYLYALLEPDIKSGKIKRPTVVVMNPPFSNSASSGKKDTHVGAEHVEQALKLLAPGGRLVAIVGNGMDHSRPAFKGWWSRIGKEYTVRANIGVNGQEYSKYGTSFDNNIIVIDKVVPNGSITPIYGKINSIDELPSMLEGVRNDRPKVSNTRNEQVSTVHSGGESASTNGSNSKQRGVASSRTTGGETSTGGTRTTDRVSGRRTQSESPASTEVGAKDNAVNDGRGLQSGGVAGDGRGDTNGLANESNTVGGVQSNEVSTDAGLAVQSVEQTREVGDGTFSEYKPSKVSIQGMKPHPTALVESSAMASVQPPNPTYSPKIPKNLIEDGTLSEAQIEQVVYAGQSHEQKLGNGERKGYFIGDGTGVGKGREISGVILDNFNNGRKKAVWISKTSGLANDAKRDLTPFGLSDELFTLETKNLKGMSKRNHGIAFTTYSSLAKDHSRVDDNGNVISTKQNKKSRMQAIVEWLGRDFDGVIVFDESHLAGNAVAIKGKRGLTKPSQQALAVVDIQKALPNARILYVSATGATEVNNLAYATRLGLWGKGSAFKDRDSFITQVSNGGISVMEIVARDMKAMGVYMARTLSYEGIENERITHELSPDQIRQYNLLAETWQMVMEEVENALVSSNGINGKAKGAAMSAFWGAHQRFFNQTLTAMQMPTVLTKARELWENGYSPVFQIVSTNEAAQNRAIEKSKDEGGDIDVENLDLSPRDILIGFVENSFPTVQYVEMEDDSGKSRWVPLVGANGEFIQDPVAVERKERLLGRLQRMKMGEAPLDMILNEFGHNNVAEVTGRSARREMVRNSDGEMEMKIVRRTKNNAKQEADEFNDGERTVLVFSGAGNTGFSFHADRKFKNQRRRVQFMIEAGYNAAAAIQGLGRTHRANESSHPLYMLCSTNLPGHKRFMSTIARRLAQLGSLTSGDRSSSGSGVFREADNLENQYAKNAVLNLFEEMFLDDRARFNDICKEMGFMKPVVNQETGERSYVNSLIDSEGDFDAADKLDIPHFLNRILAMKIDAQNELFDAFSNRMAEMIERAKDAGTFDPGMEKLKGETVEVKNRTSLWQDANNIGHTDIVEVVVTKKSKKTDYATAFKRFVNAYGREPQVYVHDVSGSVVMMVETNAQKTQQDGSIVNVYKQLKPNGDTGYTTSTAVAKNYTPLANGEAQWEDELNKVPELIEQPRYFAHGTLLPIWDKLGSPSPRFFKIVPTGGNEMQSFLGMEIDADRVNDVLARFGKSVGSVVVTPEVILKRITKEGKKVELQNGWTLKRVKVLGDNRIEIDGVEEDSDIIRLASESYAYAEKIGHFRIFVKPDADSIAAFLEDYPAVPDKGGLNTVTGSSVDTNGDKYKTTLNSLFVRLRNAAPSEVDSIEEAVKTFLITLSNEQLVEVFDDYAQFDDGVNSSGRKIRKIAGEELVDRKQIPFRLWNELTDFKSEEKGTKASSSKTNGGGLYSDPDFALGRSVIPEEYREVYNRYHNADGTAKAGYRKAPNGKKSNLTEMQWNLVRTPSFKKWFGDWEDLLRRNILEVTKAAAVRAGAFVRQDGNTVQQTAKALFSTAREYSTEVGKVTIDARSAHTSLSHGYSQKKLDALVSIQDDFNNAVYIGSEPDYNGKDIINHYFAYPIEYGERKERNYVFCRAREDKNLNRLYLHEVLLESDIKNKGDAFQTAAASSLKDASHTNASPVKKPKGAFTPNIILQRLFAVNPDSVSKVVDENGEPLVVWHGTPNGEFWQFDREKIGSTTDRQDVRVGRLGFYFINDRGSAESYAEYKGSDSKPKVMPVYLNMRNPLVVEDSGWGSAADQADARKNDLDRWAKAGGHDGIIVKASDIELVDGGKDSVYIVFSPTQIKSATDNTGAFDGGNPDIRFADPDYKIGGDDTELRDPTKYDIFSRRGDEDARQYIERIKATYPTAARLAGGNKQLFAILGYSPDGRQFAGLQDTSSRNAAIYRQTGRYGASRGARANDPSRSSKVYERGGLEGSLRGDGFIRTENGVIKRNYTTTDFYYPITSGDEIDEVLIRRLFLNLELFGEELGVKRIKGFTRGADGDIYAIVESGMINTKVNPSVRSYFESRGYSYGNMSSGYDGNGPAYYTRNGYEVGGENLKFVQNFKTKAIVPVFADIDDRGNVQKYNDSLKRRPLQGSLFSDPDYKLEGRGITNADQDAAQIERGLKVPKKRYRGDEAVMRGAEEIRSNAEFTDTLARVLKKNPRAILAEENIALAQEWLKSKDEYDDVVYSIAEATREGDTAAVRKMNARKKELEGRMATIIEAREKGVGEAARTLRTNRFLFKSDYSLAGLVAQATADLGRPLTDIEYKGLKDLADTLAKLDEQERDMLIARIKAYADKAIKDMIAQDKVDSIGKPRTTNEMRRMLRKRNDALAQIEVIAFELGGEINALIPTGEDEDFESAKFLNLRKYLRNLAQYHVYHNPNITEQELIAALIEDIAPYFTVDADTVRQIFSGYGHSWNVDRTEIQRIISDLSTKSRVLLQIADYKAGELAKLTGPQRSEPSEEARELMKIRDQIRRKKEREGRLNDSGKHLKTLLESAKTRYANMINDIKTALEAGTQLQKREPLGVTDEELETLKAEYARLKEEYDAIWGEGSKMTDEQKRQMVEKGLERALERWVDKLERAQRGDFSSDSKAPKVTSADIEALRKKIEEHAKEWRKLKAARSVEEWSDEELLAYAQRRLEAVNRALKHWQTVAITGDIAPRKKKDIPFPNDAMRDKYERIQEQRNLAYRQILDMREHLKNKERPLGMGYAWEYYQFINTVMRSLTATGDFSAMMRQTAPITLAHPVMAAKTFWKTFGAMLSSSKAIAIDKELRNNPWIREALNNGWLEWRALEGSGGSEDVEMFHGIDAQAITIGKKKDGTERRIALGDIPYLGKVLRASERQYASYINMISAELYVSLCNSGVFGKNGPTDAQKQMIAASINMMNGSAQLGAKGKQMMKEAAKVFWAPKLAVSRAQVAVGANVLYPFLAGKKVDATMKERGVVAAQMALENVRAFLGAAAAGFLMLSLFGDDDDKYAQEQAEGVYKLLKTMRPRIGSTRLDFTGGVSGWWELMHKLITGEKENSAGKKIDLDNTYGAGRGDELARFLRGKLAPFWSNTWSLFTKKNFVGEDYDIKEFAKDSVTPLAARDIWEAATNDNNGLGRGLLMAPFILVGAGGSTYDVDRSKDAKPQAKPQKSEYEVAFDNVKENRSKKTNNTSEYLTKKRLETLFDRANQTELLIKRREKKGLAVPKSLQDKLERQKSAALEAFRSAR